MVKQGIQKLKFSQQLKKSEGNKTPKVELTISVDGVAIQVIVEIAISVLYLWQTRL